MRKWKVVVNELAMSNWRKIAPGYRLMYFPLCVENAHGMVVADAIHPVVEAPYLLDYLNASTLQGLVGKEFFAPPTVPSLSIIQWLALQAKYDGLYPNGNQVPLLGEWRTFAYLLGGSFSNFELLLGEYNRAPLETWTQIWDSPQAYEIFLERLISDARRFSRDKLKTFNLLNKQFRTPRMSEFTYLVTGESRGAPGMRGQVQGRLELAVSFYLDRVPEIRNITLYPNRPAGWTLHQRHRRWQPPNRHRNSK